MVTTRRGASTLGCLFSLLLVVAVAYFTVNVGEVYLRNYRFVDAMRQEARFASTRSDDAIRRRLASAADTLGLPPEAGRVRIRRSATSLSIDSDYVELVQFPLVTREIRFTPSVDANR